eukprot:SAG11_NODE_533_length_8703_cov_7.183054_5_plen_128_part_00
MYILLEGSLQVTRFNESAELGYIPGLHVTVRKFSEERSRQCCREFRARPRGWVDQVEGWFEPMLYGLDATTAVVDSRAVEKPMLRVLAEQVEIFENFDKNFGSSSKGRLVVRMPQATKPNMDPHDPV